jgi:formylglycine-generating enzyme required for sulfatase activity
MIKQRLTGWRKLTVWACAGVLGSVAASGFVNETQREFFTTGDFDGDGKTDLVIHDRTSGKYRIGYQAADGSYEWVNHRLSGVKDATSVSVGHLLDSTKDAIVVASADANLIHLLDASQRGMTAKPALVPFSLLGPAIAVATDIGGAGNTPLDDLVVVSIYNDPTPYKVSLLRNAGGGKVEEVIAEQEIEAQPSQANVVKLGANGPTVVAALVTTDEGAALVLSDFSGSEPRVLGQLTGVPKGASYVMADFQGSGLPQVGIYKPDDTAVKAYTLTLANGSVQFSEAGAFTLDKPVKLIVAVPGEKAANALVIFGKGEDAAVFAVGQDAPVETLTPRQGSLFFGAAPIDKGFLLFSAPDYSKFSTEGQPFKLAGGNYTAGAAIPLASMADSDDSTVGDIHKRIVATLEQEAIKAFADMKPYTNIIPGTKVTYVMIPIPGGEFTMGSPEGEAGRKPDEGPVRKVKLSPFWMAKFETTWNEYELFMYPDDEKKLRADNPTEEYVNTVSDAVTRPSKPYMEMSFGMGKDGYPAISMTQHAANKYCHWLSAKTGHFYRLPTEAEWEYACRAGTTTAYSFGDDPAKIPEYGWFEENSDFKYQKVGKKKPNPWGLYDMHGNVIEWCIDQYEESYDPVKAMLTDPWNRATKPYPHVARGGSFDDPPDRLRSAARRGSSKDWKMRDPQLPKSTWWLTDAQFLGFRLVRPLTVPPGDQLQKYWTSGVERE